MAVMTALYRGNRGAANTDRNPSNNIWYDCPQQAIKEGSIPGVFVDDDFQSFNITIATTEGNWAAANGYSQFSGTGGTLTAGTGQGGEIVIASDDDNEGVGIRTTSTPFKIIRNGRLGKLWFEARIKISTIANTTSEFFIGLVENVAMTAIIPLTVTAGRVSDNNLVGFHRTETAGSTMDTIYKANGVPTSTTHTTVGSAEVTLAADTYVKLGMVYEPAGLLGNYYLTFYSNNLQLTSTKQIPSAAGTDFPNDVGLGLMLASRNAAGSTPATHTIDWWKCYQLINESTL